MQRLTDAKKQTLSGTVSVRMDKRRSDRLRQGNIMAIAYPQACLGHHNRWMIRGKIQDGPVHGGCGSPIQNRSTQPDPVLKTVYTCSEIPRAPYAIFLVIKKMDVSAPRNPGIHDAFNAAILRGF
jgi:hypothetical protein